MLSFTALFLDPENRLKKLGELQDHWRVLRGAPADHSTNSNKVFWTQKMRSPRWTIRQCFFPPSLSFHVRRTKEMGSNAAQWSSNCFKSVRHPSAYKIDFNGKWWTKEQLCWQPKGRMMHIKDTTTTKWDINLNRSNAIHLHQKLRLFQREKMMCGLLDGSLSFAVNSCLCIGVFNPASPGVRIAYVSLVFWWNT